MNFRELFRKKDAITPEKTVTNIVRQSVSGIREAIGAYMILNTPSRREQYPDVVSYSIALVSIAAAKLAAYVEGFDPNALAAVLPEGLLLDNYSSDVVNQLTHGDKPKRLILPVPSRRKRDIVSETSEDGIRKVSSAWDTMASVMRKEEGLPKGSSIKISMLTEEIIRGIVTEEQEEEAFLTSLPAEARK